MKFDIAWNFDYLKKLISCLLAMALSYFAVSGNAGVLPAQGEPSAALTQTSVVTAENATDPQTALFDKKATPAFRIPGLAEGFVPQGIAYSNEQKVYLISGYFDTLPSMIAVVDAGGTLLHAVTVRVPAGGLSKRHFGGIATFGDWVYLTGGNLLFVLSLSEVLGTKNGKAAKVLASFETCLPMTSGAEVANGVLWLSEYTDNDGTTVKEKEPVYKTLLGEKFYARADAYDLDASAPYGIKVNQVENNVIVPNRALAIPGDVQGMTVLPDGRPIFSCSYGRMFESFLYVYDASVLTERTTASLTLAGREVPLRFCRLSRRMATITAPSMFQEVAIGPDGAPCFLSESGAEKYRADCIHPVDQVMQVNLGY